MKFRRFGVALSLALLTLGAVVATTGFASAHERRSVMSYSFIVGFLNEPALVNEPNSIDLRISKTADSSPVTGLEKTLKAQISAAGKTADVPLTARFGTAGAYNGYFMPTKTGEYTFHFTGAIEGNNVDEKFTSGPSTFSSVADPVAFPDATGNASALNETVSGLDRRLVTLESKGSSGNADTALIVAIVGVLIGVAGLGVGGFALTRGKA